MMRWTFARRFLSPSTVVSYWMCGSVIWFISISCWHCGRLLLRLLHESEVLDERLHQRVLLGEKAREFLAAHVAHAEQELLHVREKLGVARHALQARLERCQHLRGRAFGGEYSVPGIDEQ